MMSFSRSRRSSGGGGVRRRGAVLLEAVLALALLLVMVGLATGAIYRTTSALQQMKDRATAEDLAVSVLSELEAGLRPRMERTAEPFDAPWHRWTLALEFTAVDGDPQFTGGLEEVSIRVEHLDSQIVFELRQWLWARPGLQEVIP